MGGRGSSGGAGGGGAGIIQPLPQALVSGILADARDDGLPDDLMER
nr:MAG TPA: hypothetical protein [Bacteriophage sp.]